PSLVHLNTLKPVEKVLRDSKIDKGNIHEVILVGGSTRIPRIVKLVPTSSTARSPTRASTPTRPLPMVPLSNDMMPTSSTSRHTRRLFFPFLTTCRMSAAAILPRILFRIESQTYATRLVMPPSPVLMRVTVASIKLNVTVELEW
ncbi:hypothetical protein AZE42_11297, partial [Rhizopogon vesiculosus]